MACLTALLFAVPTASVSSASAATSSTYDQLVFFDDFNGTRINTTKWTMTDTSKHWVMHGNNCFRSNAIQVKNGAAHITSRFTAKPINCRLPTGHTFKTDMIAGSLHTKGKFEQTYGRWEIRAKFPKELGFGHSALWMFPKEQTYGKWPRSGEIDIVERFAAPWGADHAAQSLHYLDQSGGTSYDKNDGDGNPGESHMCHVGPMDRFNWYGIEWTPTRVSFSVNGKACTTMTWDPSNVTAPAPFDHPFFTIFQQQAGGGNGDGKAHQRTLVIDKIYVWGE